MASVKKSQHKISHYAISIMKNNPKFWFIMQWSYQKTRKIIKQKRNTFMI